MIRTAGLDVGANYTKAVVLDESRQCLARVLVPTGFNLAGAATQAYQAVLAEAGLEPEAVSYVASTGYGRYVVPFRDIQITELTCHGRGTVFLFPEVRTVLDVGGQTVKAMRVDERGRVRSFRLNDKCAAGTGAFLEKTVRYMGYEPDAIADLALSSTEPVTISSVCAVFAESEVINHLTDGRRAEDIMYGAVLSLAGRSLQLMKRVGMEPAYACVGGMSRNLAFVRALESKLGKPVQVPDDAMGHFAGALGAGLLALDRVAKLQASGEWEQRALGRTEPAVLAS